MKETPGTNMMLEDIKTVAVVGTGIMGSHIALAFALAGYEVNGIDLKQDILDLARTNMIAACHELVRAGFLEEARVRNVLGKVNLTLDLNKSLSSADYVTEAVPEIVAAKQEIYELCGKLCRPEVVIGSNTSSMSISEIAAGMKHPERAVGTHWFIPPHLMPVVEIVPGSATSEDTLQLVKGLLRKVGKKPVTCKENPGFIHNYIQFAMGRACLMLLEMGVCSAEDVDTVVTNGFALRLAQLGPIRTMDYMGLDTILNVAKYMYAKTGDEAFRTPALLEKMVTRGELGLKSGLGFYSYSPEDAQRVRTLAEDAVMKGLRASA